MNPGFVATNGSDFRAYIGTCQNFQGEPTDETALNDASPDNMPQPKAALPTDIDLRCMPNPFSTATTIEYRLTEDAAVDFNLFDVNGSLLHSIEQGEQTAGVYRLDFMPRDLAPGVYYLKMHSGNAVKTTKLILVK